MYVHGNQLTQTTDHRPRTTDHGQRRRTTTHFKSFIYVTLIVVRARRERDRAPSVESSFSRKRQHDDGRAARSRLVAIKQFSKQAPHPPPSFINWHEPVGVQRPYRRGVVFDALYKINSRAPTRDTEVRPRNGTQQSE